MRSSAGVTVMFLSGALTVLAMGVVQGQEAAAAALVKALRQGGHAIVMRHASSPRQTPDKQTANPDNVKAERQLDEAGRSGSAAMGNALRDLEIPVGEVLSSPTYRALETVRLAQLSNPQVHEELGDSVTDPAAATAWLRDRVAKLPTGTNTLIVTHMPNVSRAFPDWGAMMDGEAVIVGPDGKGGVRPVGRLKIDEWPRLR